MIKKTVLTVCVFLYILTSIQAQVNIFQTDAGKIYHLTIRDDAYLFDHADYAIFIPENVKNIKGAFIHQHGCTMEGHGASTAYDIQYQALAKKWGIAVIGPDLYPKKSRNCDDWREPKSGSALALFKAMEVVGKISGHEELKDAPLLLWGHSGGGYWTLAMLRDYPEKILAAFAYSAAFNPKWDFPAAAAKAPLMVRHAGKDDFNSPSINCWQTAINSFGKLRKLNGYVSIAHNTRQNHNLSYVRYIAIPFYESVMAQRLPRETSGRMQDLNPELVWLGDTTSYNIYRASSYKGSSTAMCHFPDSLTAAKWREFVLTGTVVDHTPPPEPYDVKINRVSGNQAELTWKADADIESGIRHFIIKVNGKNFTLFPEAGAYQRFDTNGDNAIPFCLPELKCHVIMPYQAKECTVSVSAVNHFMLESEPCTAIFRLNKENF